MKGKDMPIETKMKPSIMLDKKEVPAVEGYEVGDVVDIHIPKGKIISKTERKDKDGEECYINVEYNKADCELSDEIGKEADKRGLKRKDWKEITSKRKKEGDE